MTNATTTITRYSWGALRTVRQGIACTCIIHPEQAAAVAELAEGGECTFTDEQGIRWTATRGLETICFTAGQCCLVVRRNDLEL